MNLKSFCITNYNFNKYKKNSFDFSKNINELNILANFDFKINLVNNVKFIFIGSVNGYFENKIFFKCFDIRKIFKKLKIKNKIHNEQVHFIDGNFVILEIISNQHFNIFIDKFAKNDLFYHSGKNKFLISNNFKFLIKNLDSTSINQNSVALMLNSLGTRPAKKDTIINEVRRVGLSENLKIHKKLFLIKKKYLSKKTENYDDNKILEYYNYYKDYTSKINENKNITIFMSSGYDSSFIAASARKFHPKSKINGITCKLKYSKRSGLYNIHEIAKIKKLSKKYNLKSHLIEMNLVDNFEKYSSEISDVCSQRMISNSLAAIMHCLCSKKAKSIDSENVIAGEISDGAHNLGFSQFFSYIDHESNGFREYSDKKISYLYSSYFLNKIYKKNYKDDFIFQELLKNTNIKIKKIVNFSKDNIIKETLSSLFLTSSRLPHSEDNNKIINKNSLKEFKKYHIDNYFNSIQVNSFENIYSTYLYLYNSFHWQGSTVSALNHFAELYDQSMILPFWNPNLQDFLEKMPEDWGRNLEVNKVKYPLKESFKRYLDYPEFIDKGYHSYLYDENKYIDPIKEVIFEKKTANYIKKIFRKTHPLDFLSKSYFNHNYIYRLIKNYQINNEIGNAVNIWRLFNLSKLLNDIEI